MLKCWPEWPATGSSTSWGSELSPVVSASAPSGPSGPSGAGVESSCAKNVRQLVKVPIRLLEQKKRRKHVRLCTICNQTITGELLSIETFFNYKKPLQMQQVYLKPPIFFLWRCSARNIGVFVMQHFFHMDCQYVLLQVVASLGNVVAVVAGKRRVFATLELEVSLKALLQLVGFAAVGARIKTI